MNEDLIMIMEKNLNDYRRAMFKAGKNLDRKADINRTTAIELIKFLDSERQATTETSKQHENKALHIACVSGSYCMYCEKELKPNEAIILCKKCTE